MAEPDVTVVVVPRERFSVARRALECLLSETTYPFRLVYIDGASPRSVKRYLEAEARRSGFRLLRSEHHLSPTEARNLGLREAAGTRYVVFIDNDVLVRAGWLEALVGCADETDAWLVGPLYCFGEPPFSTIHMAGGTAHIEVRDGGRYMSERHHWPGEHLGEMRPRLVRTRTELIEFHCMLVRTEVFGRLGPLDEGLLSDFEHIDFCMKVREAGGFVYLDPQAVVNWITPPPLAWSDLRYFMLRWSDAWNRASLRHFREKWQMTEQDPNNHYAFVTEYRKLAFRPLRRIVHGLLGWRRGTWVERTILFPLEEKLNRVLVPDRLAIRR
jgi:GT2 family glycosyltransferase